MGARRELTGVVLLCAAAAALALLAAGRTWAVDVTIRPPPLTEVRVERSGSALVSWLPALAWTGLAGAGALLATAGVARRIVGGLLVLAGAGIAAGAASGFTVESGSAVWWPVVTGLGGVAVAVAGVWTVVRGNRWPGLGARYERAAEPEPRPVQPADVWRALDRGEDPTAG